MKENSQGWFDREIANKIKNCDELFKKVKKSTLKTTKNCF